MCSISLVISYYIVVSAGTPVWAVKEIEFPCVRSVLGITNQQQWEQRISSGAVRAMWDDLESISAKLRKRHLEWLGHLVRMPSHQIPRICLFAWLPQTHPFHGPKKKMEGHS